MTKTKKIERKRQKQNRETNDIYENRKRNIRFKTKSSINSFIILNLISNSLQILINVEMTQFAKKTIRKLKINQINVALSNINQSKNFLTQTIN